MQTNTIYISKLTEKLAEINPYLVLLFGSYAYGTPNKDSDIDLLVVTQDDYFPKTFTENNELYISVCSHILDIAKQVPIDLIVHTKPMFDKFKELDSSFSKEILNKGIILYESKHTRVA